MKFGKHRETDRLPQINNCVHLKFPIAEHHANLADITTT